MKRVVWVLLVVLAFSIAVPAVDLTWNRTLQKGSSLELVRPYKRLVEPMPMKSGPTEGFTIERPAFRVVVGKGTLWAEADDAGLLRGLYFEGPVALSFEVSDPIERAHLKLFIGQESLKDQPVESLYVLPLGTCHDLPKPPDSDASIQGQPDYARYKMSLHADGMDWLASLINRSLHTEDDVAVLFRMKGSVWAYVMDGTKEEEVSLRRLGNPPHMELWWWDRVVSLHRDASGRLSTEQTEAEAKAKFPADVLRYDVSLTLDKNGAALEGSQAKIALHLLRSVKVLSFSCHPMLNVARVTLNEKTEVPFIKEEYSKRSFFLEPGFLVLLPDGTSGKIELTVTYTGELCEPIWGYTALKDDSGWYPVLDDADGAEFGFRASVPKGFEAVSVGQLVEHTTGQGDRETFSYDLKERVRVAGFLFGKLKHTKKSVEGIEVDVALPDNAQTLYIDQNRDAVADEIVDAIQRYTKLFGPIPYKTLHVGLTGGYTNVGFPTLVLLSYDVFERSGSSWPEQIVAHEVAHQWWFNQVTPLSYRDAWVSESLAEFSSLVCLRDRSGMDTLNKYLSHDFHTFTKLSDVLRKPYVEFGPICLGDRLFTTLDPDDAYQTIVYYKGAWMLLTLARMATFAQAGENGFYDALKDLVANYRGRLVSSLEFQQVLEKHMKVQLGWYFKQWLESSIVPKATVKTSVEGEGSGLKLVVQGTQDSQLILPIPIQAVEGKKAREFLFFLKPGGSRQEFPLTFKPDKVLVDANHCCLADYQ